MKLIAGVIVITHVNATNVNPTNVANKPKNQPG